MKIGAVLLGMFIGCCILDVLYVLFMLVGRAIARRRWSRRSREAVEAEERIYGGKI